MQGDASRSKIWNLKHAGRLDHTSEAWSAQRRGQRGVVEKRRSALSREIHLPIAGSSIARTGDNSIFLSTARRKYSRLSGRHKPIPTPPHPTPPHFTPSHPIPSHHTVRSPERISVAIVDQTTDTDVPCFDPPPASCIPVIAVSDGTEWINSCAGWAGVDRVGLGGMG